MTILRVIFPIFALVLVGYLTTYSGLLSARDIQGLSRFVFTIALPVLLFYSMAHLELPGAFDWQFLFSYYTVLLVIYGLGIWTSKHWFAQTPLEQSLFGMGSAYSNTLLVGLPIISAGLGQAALLPLFVLVSIHSAVLFFIVTVLAERGNGAGHTARQVAVQTLRNLATNPIIIGLVLGLLVKLLAVPIPKPIDDSLALIDRAALPVALFVLGGSLTTYKIAGHFREAWTMVGLKVVLMPLLVWFLAFPVFHIDPLWGAVAVMTAGMPVGINAYLFAQKYETNIATLSTAVLLSTLLTVVAQSIWLAIFL
jgi:malonate transporter